MQIGDIIRLKPGQVPRQNREMGTVLAFDAIISSIGMDATVEVLWTTGKVGWILQNRIEVIDESNSD